MVSRSYDSILRLIVEYFEKIVVPIVGSIADKTAGYSRLSTTLVALLLIVSCSPRIAILSHIQTNSDFDCTDLRNDRY